MAFDPDRLLALPPRISIHRFSRRDTMLYALGVGAGQAGEDTDLRFVFEDGLRALPTMAVVLGYPGFWQKEPQYEIDWRRVLHAGQSVRFERPLPVEGEARGEMTIDAIHDKGAATGALLVSRRRVFDNSTGELLAVVTQTSLLRGDGGKGGSPGTRSRPAPIPARMPDATAAVPTRPEQALLYRLSGDYNPLHAHPVIARAAGLPAPILHGLCTYGIAGRVVLGVLCANDPARMRRLDGRFTAPVFPGDELRVAIWRDGPGRAVYRVDVPARDATAINDGVVEFDA